MTHDRDFPICGLLPKKETKVLEFLQKNPSFDGRGVLIAILDTGEAFLAMNTPARAEFSGVDPAADGLQTTTQGEHKISDLIDCSGCGDVDMSTIITTTSPYTDPISGKTYQHTITGLSGRRLFIPSESSKWSNPSGVWRLGLKDTRDIMPKHSLKRCEEEKRKVFEKKNLELISLAASSTSPSLIPSANVKEDELHHDKVLKAQVLKDMYKNSYKPLEANMIDCIVWNDGENWRAVVDTEGKGGDLSHYPALTNYSIEHEYARLSVESMVNYSVNIYDQGTMLSIVTTSGAHGTHVASIASAHFPDKPELNGVAPGAKIVSLKIGDTRFNGLETSQAVIRACTELVRLKADVCNVSYGEGTVLPTNGRFFDLLKNEVINKSGCIFVTSAGNAGPHLTSVGAPSVVDTSIVVGAYVSHDMMDAYSVPKVKEGVYSWSSLGPAADGDVCVTIYAPGAAITSVSNSTLDKSELMNGTSMSSPNAAGCTALLLSGLKQKGLQTTPYQVKAALKHCGRNIKDPFNVPLIQVSQTFDYLVATSTHETAKLHYNIEIGKDKGRGVYLRDVYETSIIQEFKANISPFFPKNDDPATNLARIAFEVRVSLKPSKSWVSCPPFAVLNNGGKVIPFRVDPTQLSPGFHFCVIDAFDVSKDPGAAPLFQIPITICKPEFIDGSSDSLIKFDYKLENAQVVRRFIPVPLSANFAEFIFEWKGSSIPGLVQANILQILPHARYQGFWREWNFSLLQSGIGDEMNFITKKCAVLGGATLELCMGNFWSKIESQQISVQIKFHSILVSSSVSSIHSGFGSASSNGGDLLINAGLNGYTRFDLATPLRSETISLNLKFSSLLQSLFSRAQEIRPLKSRDILSNSKQVHELILSYNFSVGESCDVSFRVPRFSDAIYDSPLESMLGIVYDTNKKVLLYFDCYKRSVKLEEGDYNIKLQICSSNVAWLDDIKSTVVVIEKSLPKSISPTLNRFLDKIGTSESTVKTLKMQKGEREVFWMGAISDLPKDAKQGDLLFGTLDVTSDLSETLFNAYFPVQSEFKAQPLVPEPEGTKEIKDDLVLVKEAIRDVEIGYIKKHTGDYSKKVEYISELLIKYPTHLPLYHEAFFLYRSEWKKSLGKDSKDSAVEIGQERIGLSAKILGIIDEDEVCKYFGVYHDLSAKNEKDIKLKKEMELKRELLGSAYQSQAEVYGSIIDFKANPGFTNSADLANLDVSKLFEMYQESLDNFSKWVGIANPLDNSVYVILSAWLKFQKGLTGGALLMLEKHIASLKNTDKVKEAKKECLDLRLDFLEKLGYQIWVEHEAKTKLFNYPKDYVCF